MSPRLRAAAALLLLCLSGCALEDLVDDPFRGPRPPAPGRTAGGVPPIPSPQGPLNPAALATGRSQPSLDGGADLRIGRAGGTTTGGGKASAPGGVALGGPQALGAGAARPGTPVVPVAGGAGVRNWEEAKARLAALGVTWYALQAGEQGEYRFSCAIADKQNPQVHKMYEARDRDELAAVRAVIEQIETQK